jgi:hypothetical protein
MSIGPSYIAIFRPPPGELGADQIRPPDITYEERVTRQDLHRGVGIRRIVSQNRDALRRMSRRFQDAQPDAAHFQLVAILYRQMRKCCASLVSEDDLRSGTSRQLAMPTDEIRVQVSLNDVPDFESIRFRFIDVLLHIALRVNDGGFAL